MRLRSSGSAAKADESEGVHVPDFTDIFRLRPDRCPLTIATSSTRSALPPNGTMSISRRIHELHHEGYRLWRAGRIAEAEQIYRTMVDEVREAADALPEALRGDAHHWAAHFYCDTGRMETAEMFAREAITLEERAGGR
jgi:hypothetical protein